MLRETRNRALQAATPLASDAARRLRRHAFIKRTKLAAIAAHATIDLVIDPTADISGSARVTCAPWSNNVLHIGAGTIVGPRVFFQMSDGSARIGDTLHLRRNCVLNVSGELDIAGDSVISWGTVIHCHTRVSIDRGVVIGEYATIVDSSHYHSAPDEHIWHNVKTGSIEIGRSSWICAKAAITRDAKVGDYCIVAANSVVVGEVPSRSFASGIPATIRPLSLPW